VDVRTSLELSTFLRQPYTLRVGEPHQQLSKNKLIATSRVSHLEVKQQLRQMRVSVENSATADYDTCVKTT
jgi:hypothetical protein